MVKMVLLAREQRLEREAVSLRNYELQFLCSLDIKAKFSYVMVATDEVDSFFVFDIINLLKLDSLVLDDCYVYLFVLAPAPFYHHDMINTGV